MNKSDIDLSEIEFDHEDLSFVKVRTYGGNVHYVQNGIKFNAGFVATEVLEIIDSANKSIDNMTTDELRDALRASRQSVETATVPVPKKKSKQKIAAKPATPRQSVDDKLSAYKTPEKLDFVQQAHAENTKALRAEDHAE